MKKYVGLFLLFFGVVLIYYWKSLFSYFQGDEWYYFTQILPQTKEAIGPLKIIYHSIADANEISGGAHVTPISNFLFFLSAKFFQFTYWPYALSAIIIHTVNVFLLYLFILRLSKDKKVTLLSTFFFAISYVHFQAITWAMTYIWTALSVTFFLLSLLLLLCSFQEKILQHRYAYLSGLSLFLALLTKESTIIVFAVISLLIFLKNKSLKSKIFFIKLYGSLGILYGIYRVLLPKVLLIIHPQPIIAATQLTPLDPILALFRLFIYPLKAIPELFIPQEWFLWVSENLTPLAYPTYGAQKAVRGSDFLTFTQSAGSDLIIFILAIILLFCIGISLKITWKKDTTTFNSILFALVLIITSTFPLILIATYAPWWGYVTFIDSRHLYIASIGAGLLFAYTIIWIANKLTLLLRKILHNNLNYSPMVWVLFGVWAIVQFLLLQAQLNKEVSFGMQKKIVLQKITQTIKPSNKIVILVTSNTSYYGFGLIPPFQTNLGQVMTVLYYENGWLPQEFMTSNYLSKGGLSGEGYEEHDGKGFGYFIDENDLISQMRDSAIATKDIYGFSWNGKNNTISDISTNVRRAFQNKRNQIAQYKDWKKVNVPEGNLSFLIPPDATIQEEKNGDPTVLKSVTIISSQGQVAILVRKRTLNIGVYEDISYLKDSNGEMIGDNNYLRDISMKSGNTVTAKVSTTGDSMKYFLPTFLPDKIFEVTAIGEPSELHKSSAFAEEIISLMTIKK